MRSCAPPKKSLHNFLGGLEIQPKKFELLYTQTYIKKHLFPFCLFWNLSLLTMLIENVPPQDRYYFQILVKNVDTLDYDDNANMLMVMAVRMNVMMSDFISSRLQVGSIERLEPLFRHLWTRNQDQNSSWHSPTTWRAWLLGRLWEHHTVQNRGSGLLRQGM